MLKFLRRFLLVTVSFMFLLVITLVIAAYFANKQGKVQPQMTVSQNTGSRPNILWIIADDLSPDLHSYGVSEAHAPNIDRLAAEGIVYTHAFSNAAQCAPSRAGFMTGMQASSIGAHHMRTSQIWAAPYLPRDWARWILDDTSLVNGYEAVPPGNVHFFTEYFRAAGYFVSGPLKQDYQFGLSPNAFDSNHGTWRDRPEGAPFFDIRNVFEFHEMGTWRKEPSGANDPEHIAIPPYYPETPAVRRELTINQDNVARGDAEIGKILHELEEDGLADNTIVVFFGDHGRGLPRAKRWLYDSGIHVPLIIRWPEQLLAGERDEQLISLIDLAPTMLSIAGIPVPEYMQGQAFLGEQKAAPRQYVYATRDRADIVPEHIRAVRSQQYKYIHNYRPDLPYAQTMDFIERQETMKALRAGHAAGSLTSEQDLFFRKRKPRDELYDLHSDPHELNNLAGLPDYANVLDEMRQAEQQWVQASADQGVVDETEMIAQFAATSTGTPAVVGDVLDDLGVALVRLDVSGGGSVTYRVNKGNWRLLKRGEELRLEPGALLQAVAYRIGVGYGEMLSYRVQSAPVTQLPRYGCGDVHFVEYDQYRTRDKDQLCVTAKRSTTTAL